MSTETPKEVGLFYSVIDGTLRRKVDETTPGAVRREYETKDRGKGVKHELIFDNLEGYVEDVGIHDTEFGYQVVVKLDPNANGKNPTIQFSLETAYGRDVLNKLPGVDFTKPVYFRPYAFDKDGNTIRGVEIKQDGEKVVNQFWDYDNKKPLLGAPEAEGDVDTYTDDDWKIHYLKLGKFKREYFASTVLPRFLEERKAPREEIVMEEPTEPSPEELNELNENDF